MSRLRARCPDCRTLTAVAIEDVYECHSCGRVFGAGLVRVPQAWGQGGEAMIEAAYLPLPFPEIGAVVEQTLMEQNLAVASSLPERPLVLGGCCCAHVGAVEGLAARHGRLALVWIDAHGDLQSPATSPSGDLWGMPLRMLLDAGTVEGGDVALVGARRLDPAEDALVDAGVVRVGAAAVPAALEGAAGAYVALDGDALAPGELASFRPEPGGLTLAETATLLEQVAASTRIVGAGFSGLVSSPANVPRLAGLAAALGFSSPGS